MSRNTLSLNLLANTGLDGRGWWGVLVLSHTVQCRCLAPSNAWPVAPAWAKCLTNDSFEGWPRLVWRRLRAFWDPFWNWTLLHIEGYVPISWLSGMKSFIRRLGCSSIIDLLLLLRLGQRLISWSCFILRIHRGCRCFSVDQNAICHWCLKTTYAKCCHLLRFHVDLTIIVTQNGCPVCHWLLRHQSLRYPTDFGVPDDLGLMDSPRNQVLNVGIEGRSRPHYSRCGCFAFQSKLSFLEKWTPCIFISSDVQIQHLIVALLLISRGRPNWMPAMFIDGCLISVSWNAGYSLGESTFRHHGYWEHSPNHRWQPLPTVEYRPELALHFHQGILHVDGLRHMVLQLDRAPLKDRTAIQCPYKEMPIATNQTEVAHRALG